MKKPNAMVSERFCRSAAGLLASLCYLMIALCALVIVLSALGRQTFTLHTPTGTYEDAILAEAEHGRAGMRWFTVGTAGEIHLRAEDEIDAAARVGITALAAIGILPMVFAFWHLARALSNIRAGRVFTEENARRIFYYGLLQLAAAIVAPALQLLTCRLVSAVSINELSFSTGQNALGGIVQGIAFLVAAYVIRYGVALKDEVDCTL